MRTRELEDERKKLNAEKKKLTTFMKTLASQPIIQTRFTEKTFLNTIDHIDASDRFLIYHFYGSEHVKVEIEMLRMSCL